MSTITKSLSTKTDAIGFAQVLFFVRNGRKHPRLRIKSGVFVPSAYWSEARKELSVPKKASAEVIGEVKKVKEELSISETRVHKLIELYEDKADKEFIEKALSLLKSYDGTLTKEIVEGVMLKPEEENEVKAKKYDLFRLTEDFFVYHQVSEPRQRLYRTIFRTMARYQLYCQHVKKNGFCWDLDTTSKENVCDFFEYMAIENELRIKSPKIFKDVRKIYPENDNLNKKDKEPRIQARGNNRLVDMKKSVKAFWNWLLKNDYTTNNPFAGVEIGMQNFGTPYYLTIEERNKIASADMPTKHLEVQRDIFIFQCLIGCRVGDLTTFKADNIVNDILVYTPHKTKDKTSTFTARVPLNEMALLLIKKYEGVDKRGRLFPFISDQKYNEAIKDVLTTCEIKRMVNVRNPLSGESEMKPLNEVASSHMARRTFVGNAYKVVKDPNLIGRMSGHVEGSKAFVRYRDIDDEMLKEVINKIK